jgi:hypothetical protein
MDLKSMKHEQHDMVHSIFQFVFTQTLKKSKQKALVDGTPRHFHLIFVSYSP